ncbi:hypothetical protein HMPREF0083_06033 [Aneurinibacillus aneurinilyticus ATCC 12856]|uniref:Uncharacterized protein n=1 Tax=Aneurinibacillus aneurinilyticus ATCC 12856 TaxID=649747 RepID=U1Y0K6_ANEAE|nr:hypothetical protein HMPREF0083_06033 [Aneurinibacillus aneurinilyticus ATCC 12856]
MHFARKNNKRTSPLLFHQEKRPFFVEKTSEGACEFSLFFCNQPVS